MRARGKGVREIAHELERDPGTISRELRRNIATRGGKSEYRALVALWKAQEVAKRPKTAKLAANDALREYVQERLEGTIRRIDGSVVTGPQTPPWKGLNKPHRADRRWSLAWSPEQISHRLKIDFPDDESIRISHEAIYQSLYIEDRGPLKRELVAALRTGRALRKPRARSQNTPQRHVAADVVICERPSRGTVGVVPDTLWGSVKQAQIYSGGQPGTTTMDAARIKQLGTENRELKRANEILLTASTFFAREPVPRPPR